MEVFLHIGFPKTGSSAIQSHIFTNQSWFRQNGIYIPQAGYNSGFGHSSLLAGEDSPLTANSSYYGLRENSAITKLAQELYHAEQRGIMRALISWEGLASSGQKAIEAIKQALEGHHVTLLAYVREQSALYQSARVQNIESLNSLSSALLFERNNTSEITPSHLDFYAVLSLWKAVFSDKVDIKVRVYEKPRLKGGNVVLDFLDWLDLQESPGFSLQSGAVNPSLDCRSAALLMVAHAAGLRFNELLRLSKALSRVVGQHGAETREFLTPPELDDLRQHYRDSNQQLFAKFTPENFDSDQNGFVETVSRSASSGEDIQFAYFRDIYQALNKPQLEVWQGEALFSKRVAKVASPPNEGWRGAEPTGVWSIGQQSVLAFLLPQTDPVAGPIALSLTMTGQYIGPNTKTKVTASGKEMEISLTHSELRIEIDDQVREQGVKIVLQHAYPQPTGDANQSSIDNRIAFKLEFLSYKFIWE